MTSPPRPSLKSITPTPTGPRPAEPAHGTSGSGAPKDAARKGALSALRPDPHPPTVTGIRPGLSVRGMGRSAVPAADWLCVCGHHERARGKGSVEALTSRVRVGTCPHRPAITSERRAAA